MFHLRNVLIAGASVLCMLDLLGSASASTVTIGTPDRSSIQYNDVFANTVIDYSNPNAADSSSQRLESEFGPEYFLNEAVSTSGNLATGQLKAVASVNGPGGGGPEVGIFLRDRIFINEGFSGELPINVTMAISGEFSGASPDGDRPVDASVQGVLFLEATAFSQDDVYQSWQNDSTSPISTIFSHILSTTINVSSDHPYFDLLAALYVSANTYVPISGVGPAGSVTANFGHTATLALILPTGFTFSSDSGVFLTDPQVPQVPLPAALPLLLGGLAGIGLLGRVSRRGAV